MSWGYWTGGLGFQPTIPPVATYRAMTSGKHMVHMCERFAMFRTDGLQYAFFNGVGYEAWENVWGMWNQLTPRDSEALRRTSSILRNFGNLITGIGLINPDISR